MRIFFALPLALCLAGSSAWAQAEPTALERIEDYDDGGRLVATGVYFYRLQTETGEEARRMLLLR